MSSWRETWLTKKMSGSEVSPAQEVAEEKERGSQQKYRQ